MTDSTLSWVIGDSTNKELENWRLLKASNPEARPFSITESVMRPERATMRTYWPGSNSLISFSLEMCILESIRTRSLRPAYSCLIRLQASNPFIIGMSRSRITTSNGICYWIALK